MYTRYGHVNQIFVKVGDIVKIGDKIATNGTGNGQWAAHLHRDHPKEIPGGNYAFYNIGWTKEKTLATFNDPFNYPKALGGGYSHLGYGWLEYANYGTASAPKMCYHPGLDENGLGSGNDDYDDPVYAVADGLVEYVYSGTGSNGGWGHLIVIKEETTMDKDFVKAVSDLCGEDFGANLNEAEQKQATKKLNAFNSYTKTLEEANGLLTEKVNEYGSKLEELTNQNVLCQANTVVLEEALVKAKELASGGIIEMTFLDLLRELKNRIIRF